MQWWPADAEPLVMRIRLGYLSALGSAIVVLVSGVGVPAASAAVGTVAIPSGLRVVHATSSSFTVATKPAANATEYRLFASTDKSDLAIADISRAHSSHLAATPRITLTGLRYTTSPYYFRVEALNSKHRRFSKEIGSAGLAPAAPSNLVASTSPAGTVLNWSDTGASGYRITQATDSALSRSVKAYTVIGSARQFSPPDVAAGTTYYFAVRAMNTTTASGKSNTVATTVESKTQPVKVMTYNILEASQDGKAEGDGVISPWAKRKPGVVALIHRADPDVIAIQEAAAWTDQAKRQRQIDSLATALHGRYSLAVTEIKPTERHYSRTGDYILYKSSLYSVVGVGGHWVLGNGRDAAYQILKNKASDARFLFVSPHLAVLRGRVYDAQREHETSALLSDVARLNTASLPVVVAGDFNSATDGPSTARNTPASIMQTAKWENAENQALTRKNAQYNSVNQYYRTPPTHGLHVDDIVTTPGVQIRSWEEVVDLHHHKFLGPIPSDHNPVEADIAIPYS
jgi:endonuclease/exonuclease/phosphatase family metal-dependent hydrolase